MLWRPAVGRRGGGFFSFSRLPSQPFFFLTLSFRALPFVWLQAHSNMEKNLYMTMLKQGTPHRPFCTEYTSDTSATLKLLNYAILIAILIDSLLLEYFAYRWVRTE